jgi:hypothetical protein
VVQAGGGIAISGLPAVNAEFNATYAPTGEQVAGYPAFSAGPTMHLFRHPEADQWQLSFKPFDPAVTGAWARIPAAAGPVPTGAGAWTVWDGAKYVEAEVTAREVDAAAAALEAERAAVAAAQGKRVVPLPPAPLGHAPGPVCIRANRSPLHLWPMHWRHGPMHTDPARIGGARAEPPPPLRQHAARGSDL